MSTTATQEATKTSTASNQFSFSVQIDTKRNGDVVLQSIPGCRLRGGIDPSKTTIADTKQKVGEFEPMIPVDQTATLGAIPKVPGQIIEVNPESKTYRIFDPLRDDESLKERLASALRLKGYGAMKIQGVKESVGTLDIDRMKTLCRELTWLVKANDAKVVKGDLPDEKALEKMKGRFLQNPGSQTPNMQPRYEEQMEEWVQKLAQGGG